jgi:hypothetical protein
MAKSKAEQHELSVELADVWSDHRPNVVPEVY